MDTKTKKITAAVLAAGQATRMGRPKQLLPWGSTTILGQTLAHVKASAVDAILLVSGAYREEVEQTAAEFNVPAVFNPDFEAGEMISSLKTAVRLILKETDQPADGVLVMLADLPFIPPAIINQVLAAFRTRAAPAVVPVFDSRRGHPVIIGQGLFDALLTLPAGAAPRDLFRGRPDRLVEVEVDSDVILRDIDTFEQYLDLRP